MAAPHSAQRALGHAIRAAREAAQLTQTQLGKRAGIVGNGSGKKNGNGKPSALAPPPDLRELADLSSDKRRVALAVVKALLALCR